MKQEKWASQNILTRQGLAIFFWWMEPIVNKMLQIGSKVHWYYNQKSMLINLLSDLHLRYKRQLLLTDKSFSGVSSEHPELGLEAGWWRDLPGGAQARLHRPVLPRPRVQHNDGKPVRNAELQNCEYSAVKSSGINLFAWTDSHSNSF